MIQLYDSEIIAAEKVLTVLRRLQGMATNLEAFRKEAVDRFHKAGLIVDVKVFSTDSKDTYAFDIEILDRVKKDEFDHDQMAYEVRNDILGFGTGGLIKPSKEEIRKALEVERCHRKGCSHNHG